MKKILLLCILTILIMPFVQSSIPTMIAVTAVDGDNLEGWCQATDDDNLNLSYEWKWFSDDNLHSEGTYNTSLTNITNVTSYYTEMFNGSLAFDNDWSTYSYINTSGETITLLNYTQLLGQYYGMKWKYKVFAEFTAHSHSYCYNWTNQLYEPIELWEGNANPVNLTYNTTVIPLDCYSGGIVFRLSINKNVHGDPRLYESILEFNQSTEMYTSGQSANIQNISSATADLQPNWIFSCRATNGKNYSEWVNSSSTTTNSLLNLHYQTLTEDPLYMTSQIKDSIQGFYINATNITLYESNMTLNDNVYISIRKTTDVNFTQFYEFTNNQNTIINDTLTIMTAPTREMHIQVRSEGGEEIEDALVIMRRPYTSYGVITAHQKVGQRLTQADGTTSFLLNPIIPFGAVVSKDGYTPNAVNIPASYTQYPETDPLIIVLRRTDYTELRGITLFIQKYIINKTNDVTVEVHSPTSNDITIRTNYMITNNITAIQLTDTTDTDVFGGTLTSGTHFSQAAGNIVIQVYTDDTWNQEWTVTDISTLETPNVLPEPDGLEDEVLKVIIIIIAVLAAGFVSVSINHENSGIITFYIMMSIGALIITSYLWVVMIPLLKMVANKLIGITRGSSP